MSEQNSISVSPFRCSQVEPDSQSLAEELAYYKKYCEQLEAQNASLNEQLFANLQAAVPKNPENSDADKIIKQLKMQIKQKEQEEKLWTKRYEEQLNQIIELKALQNRDSKRAPPAVLDAKTAVFRVQTSRSPNASCEQEYKFKIKSLMDKIDEQENQINALNKRLNEYTSIQADFDSFKQSDLNTIHQQLESSEQCIQEMRKQIQFKDSLLQESIKKYENLLHSYELLQQQVHEQNKKFEKKPQFVQDSNRNRSPLMPSNGNLPKFPEQRTSASRTKDPFKLGRMSTEPDLHSSNSISNLMSRDI